jgi:CheY-like chemotaxis protein
VTRPPESAVRQGEPVILVVEDEHADALLILRALKRAGVTYDVRLIDDGERARDYLLGKPPHDNRARYPMPSLVLLDLKLRKLGGLDILKQLQQAGTVNAVPIIVLSSSSRDDDIEKAYRYGANSYLVKPARFQDFCKLAEQIRSYWLSMNESIR